MGLNIKNPATEAAIREFAAMEDIPLTEAVDRAIREAISRRRGDREKAIAEKRRKLERIAQAAAACPRLDQRPLAQIMDEMYDEHGLPI